MTGERSLKTRLSSHRRGRLLSIAVIFALVASGSLAAGVATPRAWADEDGLGAMQDRYRELAREAGSAVVGVSVRASNPRARGQGGRARVVERYGAGTLIDDQGHILTSTSVIPGGSGRITVTFRGGRKAAAEEVGRDRRNGVVLIKVKKGLRQLGVKAQAAELGSSSSLKTGQLVMSLGNPYGSINTDSRPAFSVGVVSGVYRFKLGSGSYKGKAIETTAAVNPGSYGGPLVDRHGKVVGIVTDAYSHGRWLGMATPIDQVQLILDDLRAGREPAPAFLGVSAHHEADKGVIVDEVMAGSPAAKAGIATGDRIAGIDASKVFDLDDVSSAVGELPPGTDILMKVVRGSSERQVAVKLGRSTEKFLAWSAAETGGQTPEAAPAESANPQVSSGDRGYLGVYLVEESDGTDGAVIEDVADDSPAAKAGLKKGDVITALAGKATPNSKALISQLVKLQAGQTVTLRVSRGGWGKDVKVTIAPIASDEAPAEEGPQPGFLGVYLKANPEGRGALVDGSVAGSPAEKSGLAKGDIIVAANGKKVADHEALIEILKTLHAGDGLQLQVMRDGWGRNFGLTLGSRPGSVEPPAEPRARRPARPRRQPKPVEPPARKPGFLGVALEEVDGGLRVEEVVEGSPAATAGLKVGDVVVGLAGKPVKGLDELVGVLGKHFAGDTIELRIQREGWRRDLKVTLGERQED